jgi:hypothetical protein
MTAISQKLPNLIGGVSQQPDTLKLSNQFRSCTNYYPDLTFGLAKRPGIKGIAKLAGAIADGTWFTMFRDQDEKYLVQFSKAGALRIWNAKTGEQQTVNAIAAGATAYATHTLSDQLALFQINDYAFVINRNITVAEKTGSESASSNPFAFVAINTVAYSTTYTIILDGNTFSYNTPTTSTTAVNVNSITGGLTSSINGNVNYVATAIGNVVHIRRANNTNFSIEAYGGTNNTAIEPYKGIVPLASKLPQQFINDLKIKVEASEDSKADDYWVQFKTADGGVSGTGSWIECIAPGVKERMDESTMPHAIIREANGTFTFRVLDKASALASTSSATINGTVTGISIVGTPTAQYKIGQIFSVTGGLGTELQLEVVKTRTDVLTNNYAYPSVNYVKAVTTIITPAAPFRPAVTSTTYTFFVNNTQIGTNINNSNLVIGNTIYKTYGSPVSNSFGTFYGMTISTTTPNVLDQVAVKIAGKNYAVNDTVQNVFGDSFTVTSITSTSNNADKIIGNYWKYRETGDNNTNPMPSFVGKKIHGISFFRNRLVLMSGENVICSQAGDYFNFFLSTVITTVQSDVVDISCGSLRPVELKYALPNSKGLLLFSAKSQYLLTTTTESFSSASAEINAVSQYEQDEDIGPFDTGSSIVFIKQGDTASSVYEMSISGDEAEVIELTRTIPSFIPNAISYLTGSSSASTFALTTPQESNEIYLFRYFNAETRVMASWFKWTVPGIIESLAFDHDIMYLVLKQDNAYVLGHVNLLTDTPGGAVLFENKYVDLRLDLFDYKPTLVYDAVNDETKVCFKDGFENTSQQPVVVSLDINDPGVARELPLQTNLAAPVGQRYFVKIDGNQTTKPFALGYKYIAEAELPAFYVVQDEGRKDTLNIPTVHRIQINSYESGPFKVKVDADNRPDFNLDLPQEIANLYTASTVPMVRNAINTIPIMAKGTQVNVTLIADGVFPTAFTSLNWEGTYNNKGIRPL